MFTRYLLHALREIGARYGHGTAEAAAMQREPGAGP